MNDESIIKVEIVEGNLKIGSNLSKREYFSSLILDGLVSKQGYFKSDEEARLWYVTEAVKLTDMLIEELKK